MTLAEFAKGTTTFVVVIVAGLLSEIYLDRHLAASEAERELHPRRPTRSTEISRARLIMRSSSVSLSSWR